MTLEADTLEEKVFQMQVFFERLIIPKFRRSPAPRAAPCSRTSATGSRSTTASTTAPAWRTSASLLEHASKKTKDKLIAAANQLLPVFVQHELWRPRERAWMGSAMRSADVARLRSELENGIKMAQSLGLDVSEVELPRLAA